MKKVISTLITILLLCSLCCVSVFADEENVAKIGSTEFKSFSEALAAAETGDTITILRTCSSDVREISPSTTSATMLKIDLNGYEFRGLLVENSNPNPDGTPGVMSFYDTSELALRDIGLVIMSSKPGGKLWTLIKNVGSDLTLEGIKWYSEATCIKNTGKLSIHNCALSSSVLAPLQNYGGTVRAEGSSFDSLHHDDLAVSDSGAGSVYLADGVQLSVGAVAGNVTFPEGSGIVPNPDPRAYPYIIGPECTVTFMNGSTVYDTKTVLKGYTTVLPDVPSQSPETGNDYFIGWTSYKDMELPDFTQATPVSEDITVHAVWVEPVASITKNGVTDSFGTLKDALAAAESGDTIKLIRNTDPLSGETFAANSDPALADVTTSADTLTFDLNGHLYLSGNFTSYLDSLTVTDSVGTGIMQGLGEISNYAGTLTLSDISISNVLGIKGYAGTTNIKNCTVNSVYSPVRAGGGTVNVQKGTKLTITGEYNIFDIEDGTVILSEGVLLNKDYPMPGLNFEGGVGCINLNHDKATKTGYPFVTTPEQGPMASLFSSGSLAIVCGGAALVIAAIVVLIIRKKRASV